MFMKSVNLVSDISADERSYWTCTDMLNNFWVDKIFNLYADSFTGNRRIRFSTCDWKTSRVMSFNLLTLYGQCIAASGCRSTSELEKYLEIWITIPPGGYLLLSSWWLTGEINAPEVWCNFLRTAQRSILWKSPPIAFAEKILVWKKSLKIPRIKL